MDPAHPHIQEIMEALRDELSRVLAKRREQMADGTWSTRALSEDIVGIAEGLLGASKVYRW